MKLQIIPWDPSSQRVVNMRNVLGLGIEQVHLDMNWGMLIKTVGR